MSRLVFHETNLMYAKFKRSDNNEKTFSYNYYWFCRLYCFQKISKQSKRNAKYRILIILTEIFLILKYLGFLS